MKNAHLLGAEDRPAPGRLRFVQGLLNTLDVERGTDRLADTPQAAAWLERFGLVADARAIDAADTARLRTFREAVRTLISTQEDQGQVRDAAEALHQLSAGIELGVRFDTTGTVSVENRSTGIEAAIGALIVAMHEAQMTGTWERLKSCARDSCRWAFYDASKNHSSNWCSMQTCGNREKV